MRVRIELRRQDGVWIARFRKAVEMRGELISGIKEMGGRMALFVHLAPVELHPGQAPFVSPVLYEPKFASAFGNEFRLQGWEVTEGRAWCAQ
ncbi:MAG: hypothetical protein EON54_18610, partial [Alcaligenaceae bacterium]